VYPRYPSNEEVLAGYHDALLQCRRLSVDDLFSQLQQDIESLKKRETTEAEARAALAYKGFLAKIARLALHAKNRNSGSAPMLFERWMKTAREFVAHVDVPLIEATRVDADGFRGDRIALDALFAFLTAERSRLGVKKRRNMVIKYSKGDARDGVTPRGSTVARTGTLRISD
jgi:hypothetical protein